MTKQNVAWIGCHCACESLRLIAACGLVNTMKHADANRLCVCVCVLSFDWQDESWWLNVAGLSVYTDTHACTEKKSDEQT